MDYESYAEGYLPPPLPEVDLAAMSEIMRSQQEKHEGGWYDHTIQSAMPLMLETWRTQQKFNADRGAMRAKLVRRQVQRADRLTQCQADIDDVKSRLQNEQATLDQALANFYVATSRFAVVCEPDAKALQQAAYEKNGCSDLRLEAAIAAADEAQRQLRLNRPFGYASAANYNDTENEGSEDEI